MTVKEATINIALMEYVTEEEGEILKPVRGSSLPLKIKTDARYKEVLEAALKKGKTSITSFHRLCTEDMSSHIRTHE